MDWIFKSGRSNPVAAAQSSFKDKFLPENCQLSKIEIIRCGIKVRYISFWNDKGEKVMELDPNKQALIHVHSTAAKKIVVTIEPGEMIIGVKYHSKSRY